MKSALSLVERTVNYFGLHVSKPGHMAYIPGNMNFLSAVGNFIASGGSIANLTAVVTAREFHQIRTADIEKCVAYYSSQSHHSNAKAIHVAGMSGCQHRIIPVNNQFRLNST